MGNAHEKILSVCASYLTKLTSMPPQHGFAQFFLRSRVSNFHKNSYNVMWRSILTILQNNMALHGFNRSKQYY